MHESISIGYLPVSLQRKADQSYVNYKKSQDPKSDAKIGAPVDPSSGDTLLTTDFKSLILSTADENLYNPSTKKHHDGLCVRYDSRVIGKFTPGDTSSKNLKCKANEYSTSKMVWVDIDKLTRPEVDKVFDLADDIFRDLPFVMGIQKSSSYYTGKPTAGLHIFCRVDEFSNNFCPVISCIISSIVFDYIDSALDLSNKKWDTSLHSFWQRFFLHYGEVRWNDNYIIFDPKSVSKETSSRLKVKYREIFKGVSVFTPQRENTGEKVMYSNNSLSAVVYDGEKLVYPSELVHLGHKDRFQIAAALVGGLKVKRDVFKEFFSHVWSEDAGRCVSDTPLLNQYWNQSDNRSQKYIGSGLNKLRKRGWLVKETKGCDLKADEYISKYEDEIVEFIKSHRRCAIEAPTGSGKTTLINGTLPSNTTDIELFDDFGSVGIARRLNAVVIVPFNTTNRLYDNLYEVSTGRGNSHDRIPSDKACVMVMDQAFKHIDEIKGRQIIIDESHVLFTDRTYRENAARLLVELRKSNSKVCCVSATFTGELEALGVKDIYRKTKDRRTVKVKYVDTNPDNRDIAFLGEMYDPRYDRVVVFSDAYAIKALEHLISNDKVPASDITILHSRFADTTQFNKLKESELLDTRYTICTRLAYNGLNFKNEGEKIKVVTDFVPGETLPAEVIQAIGRVRKSSVDVSIVRNDRGVSDVKEAVRTAKEVSSLEDKFSEYGKKTDSQTDYKGARFIFDGIYNKKYDVEEVAEACVEIDEYRKKYSTFENLEASLFATGYVYLTKTECKVTAKFSLDRKQCKETSGYYIDYLRENNSLPDDDEGEDIDAIVTRKYVKEWNRKIERLMMRGQRYNIKLSISDVISIYELSDKQITMPSVLEKVSTYIDAVSYTDEEWEVEKEIFYVFKGMYADRKDDRVYKKVCERWRELNSYRDYALGCEVKKVRLNDGRYMKFLEQMLKKEKKRANAGRKKGAAKGGKNSSPKKKVEYNGVVYDSCAELALAVNKRIETISKWIKDGKIRVLSQ